VDAEPLDPTYETEKLVARKSKEKKEETEFVGLLGIGFDNHDEHKRITKGEEFFLVGGSEETHERMQDVVIHVTEALKSKGKRLQDAEVEEVIDLFHEANDK
jgi:hypothetical protein